MRLKEIMIRGDKWKYRLCTKEEMQKITGNSETIALTIISKKQILFTEYGSDFRTVMHEIFHAFATYLFTDSADLSKGQQEEISAEFIADSWYQLVIVSITIYKDLCKNLKIKGNYKLFKEASDNVEAIKEFLHNFIKEKDENE